MKFINFADKTQTIGNLHHIIIMTSATDKTFKLGLLLSVIDWVTFNVVYLLGLFVFKLSYINAWHNWVADISVANISYIIALQFVAISLHHRHSQPARVLRNTSRTALIFTILHDAILGMAQAPVPGFSSSLLVFFIIFLATTMERLALRSYIIKKRGSGKNNVKTVIIGSGEMVQKAVNVMTNIWSGYSLSGYFNDSKDDSLRNQNTGEEIPFLGNIYSLIPYLENHHIDELYIGIAFDDLEELKSIRKFCQSRMIRVYFLPQMAFTGIRKAKIHEFGDIYVINSYNEPLKEIKNRIMKRTLDIVVSLIFLCTIFPFVLVIVFIISKITMPGPLFFKQKRTGYDGKDFYCYKFRSMKVNKDSDKVQAVKDDPRVTKWGAFMRHTNIDELPQFINVLKGNMSLVGPRPHMLAHTEYYSNLISDYMIRHYVKPGITGWAQTHGERGETKTVDDMARRVKKDIWYIENWSFWLDIQIIFKTISDAIHGDEKAY